jgi:hypothetical protein
MSENIIELKFRSPHIREDDGLVFLACISCRNKTYTLVYDRVDEFPLMKCAACGQAMGRVGWAPTADEPEGNKSA